MNKVNLIEKAGIGALWCGLGKDTATQLARIAIEEPPIVVLEKPRLENVAATFDEMMETELLKAVKSLSTAYSMRDSEKFPSHVSRKAKSIIGTKAPSRNKQCPCGSGRKYKRCCNLNK